MELLLKSGDYNPLLQQIHPLNHKSNDKHSKPAPIKNTRKKTIIENIGGNITPINEIFVAKRKKLNDSNVVDKSTKDKEDKCCHKMCCWKIILIGEFQEVWKTEVMI